MYFAKKFFISIILFLLLPFASLLWLNHLLIIQVHLYLPCLEFNYFNIGSKKIFIFLNYLNFIYFFVKPPIDHSPIDLLYFP